MVKRGSALAVTLSVAFAAMRLATPATAPHGATPGPAKRLSSTLPFLSIETPPGEPLIGGCSAYLPEKTPEEKPTYPGDENKYAATKVIKRFFGEYPPPGKSVRYAIALAPDPAHTNLSLMFDREIALIQQAAEDQGYLYDSSWMPWNADAAQPLGDLPGRQKAADLVDAREACPGVLLFRKQADPNKPAADSYGAGLVVLVVGEQATGGINDDQWANAIKWLSDKKSDDNLLRILGPTFSGSFVSLERYLHDIYGANSKQPLFAGNFPSARILSGSVSGCSSVEWFQRKLHDQNAGSHALEFGSFQENDSLHIFRFVEYLKSQKTDPKDIAILSEDETAYAALPTTQTADDGCAFSYDVNERPVNLVYPRDISALRDAYEKQSVFDTSSGGSKDRSIHPILHDVGGTGTGNGEIKDTVPTYSGGVSAISQEAYLYGVVSFLRTHHTRYLVLRSTNPLDYLFLTRFFHRAYPEARIVTVGTDILFRREIDTTEFRGVMSLTSYPLLPRDQHWAKITDDDWDKQPHDHLVFEGHLPEGQYIAARYLLQDRTFKSGEVYLPLEAPVCGISAISTPLAYYRTIPTPDYAEPFWHSAAVSRLIEPAHPPTWLVAVGRDGYWPIAILNQTSDVEHLAGSDGVKTGVVAPPSTMVQLQPLPLTPQHYELESVDGALTYSHRLRITLPLPWVACSIVAFLLGFYQCLGIFRGHGRSSDGLLSVFERVDDPAQKLILGFSSVLAILPLVALMFVTLVPPHVSLVTNSTKAIIWWPFASAVLGLAMMVAYVHSLLKDKASGPRANLGYAAICFALPLALFSFLTWCAFTDKFYDADLIPRFYRLVHITDGVSPLFPVLLLTLGFYLWAWQALAGNLILAKGCPTLPEVPKPQGATKDSWWKDRYKWFIGRGLDRPEEFAHELKQSDERISQNLGRRILQIASPFGLSGRIVAVPPAIVIAAILLFGPNNLPLLSLEGNNFNSLLNLLLLVALMVTMVEALRLYSTWTALRKLLHALARLRLRRTIARLRRIESNSLWSVSGNVRRFQYGVFVQQIEAADRLTSLMGFSLDSLTALKAYSKEFTRRAEAERDGAPWSASITPPQEHNKPQYPPKPMRQVLSEAVADIYCRLDAAWAEETTSLNLEAAGEETDDPAADPRVIPLSKDECVQAAEEFVAFHYIAFIQNIVARMRTITLSMTLLFVSVCLAISFYPFVPRTQISIWMMVNLALIGLSVAYVYAGMDRDEILSYIANTRPGRLGPEFYIKIAGFLVGPILGILTTQFPAIADTAMQWLQPGLDAIK